MANLTGNIIVSVGISSGEYVSARDTTLIKKYKGLSINKQSLINTPDITIFKNNKTNQISFGHILDLQNKELNLYNNTHNYSISLDVSNNNGYSLDGNDEYDFETTFFLNMENNNIKKYKETLDVLNYNSKLKIKNNWYIQTSKQINYSTNRITKLIPDINKSYKDIMYVKKENLSKSTGGTGGGSSVENFDGLELNFPLQKYTSVKIRFKMDSVVEFFDLPEGIKYNSDTREIEGIPLKAGSYISKMKVNNEKEYKIYINIPYFTRTSLI